MDTKNHTVTLPIADYQKLIQTSQEFKKLKEHSDKLILGILKYVVRNPIDGRLPIQFNIEGGYTVIVQIGQNRDLEIRYYQRNE